MKIECFKAYDVRGIVGESVTEPIFYQIAVATAKVLNVNSVIVGHDARRSSPALALALIDGFLDAGVDVIDIGLCGTEEVYFSTPYFEASAGLMVTASHNPINYNGIKFVGKGSRPLEVDSEFDRIRQEVEIGGKTVSNGSKGFYVAKRIEARDAYVDKILNVVSPDLLPPLKVVVNCGNGAAGPALRVLKEELLRRKAALQIIEMFNEPDSTFPHGIPNPSLSENHHWTAERVKSSGADFGVAFDGDFDRCFLFDEKGDFVPGEMVVGLLSRIFLERHPDSKIVQDPRLVLNTSDLLNEVGTQPILSKTGHLFMKQVMRAEGASYGGEMSAHHYFRDFYFCDSGMIPWLLICTHLAKVNSNLSRLVDERKALFPSSGELNFKLENPTGFIEKVEGHFKKLAIAVDRLDGLSMEFREWRFNLRASNTEPLVRLNVETRGDRKILSDRVEQIKALR